MKNLSIKMYCICQFLFVCLVFFGDVRICAANEDSQKWSFAFNEYSPAEVLQQMGAICGVDLFIDQKYEAEGFTGSYHGFTLDQMLSKLLHQENYALVWRYEADRLKAVDIWIFNGKIKADSQEIFVENQKSTAENYERVDAKAQLMQGLERPPMIDKPSGLEPPPMPPTFE